jgi:hypothetical protein
MERFNADFVQLFAFWSKIGKAMNFAFNYKLAFAFRKSLVMFPKRSYVIFDKGRERE